jgi:UbiA prenyltransferase family
LRQRWWCYFGERFPLHQHGVLIGVFCLAVVAYARALDGSFGWPPAHPFAVAFVTSLLLFLQLRIFDEFKDFEEDARYRPYRAVPRGLVSLRELGWLWAITAAVQLALSITLGMTVLGMLMLAWAYSLLMAKEFFIRRWLKAHPVAYMGSHMVVIPLIVLHVAACAITALRVVDLAWLGAASYASFCVFEIGRKIRAPADEREGVEMYSALWGTRRAVLAWLAVLVAAAVLATLAARSIGATKTMASTGTFIIILSAALCARFLRNPRTGGGRIFLGLSALWLVAAYGVLGATAMTGGR